MPGLDQLFGANRARYQHPILQMLDRNKTEASRVRVKVDHPKDILGHKPAMIYLSWNVSDTLENGTQVAWDAELNEEMVRRQYRSGTVDDETVRFSLALRDAFSKPESRFGDGYFNAVLIEVVRELGFASFESIKNVLTHISEHKAGRHGSSFDDCRSMIVGIISERANQLIEQLGYTQDEAKSILANAMAQYLDDRYTVTDRIRLGWTS